MKKIVLLFAATIAALGSFAQITANGFSSRSLTAYTNGATNDSIYFYCAGELGSLTATPSGGVGPYDFTWQQYSTGTNSYVPYLVQNDLNVATVNNLPAGGYRVSIADANGNIVGCDRAWISQVLTNPSVNVDPIPGGCGAVNLNGQVTYATATPYYNPPPDPMLINANTQITVCFSGNHTFVSDIYFLMVGPPSCGSPVIQLSPNPAELSNCNGGDNFNNLCFTNVQSFPNFNMCGAPTPLTGTYDSYGAANTPINWAALNGCNAAAGGWVARIDDCIGVDSGALTNATITFIGQDACGQNQTITYTTAPNFNATINDSPGGGNCTQTPFNVPVNSAPIAYQNGYQWSANPSVTIPNATSSLTPTVNPGPTQNTTFTLTITGNGPGAACGGTISDSELREYVVPATPVINPVQPSYCVGAPIFNLTASPSGGTWSGPGIVNPITGAFNSNNAGGPGLKTIVYTISLGGCVITTSVQINLLPSANATITNPGPVCLTAAPFQLTAATAGGTWSGTGIIDAATGLFDPSVAGVGTTTITYTIPNACNGTATAQIVVLPGGVANITNPGVLCTSQGAVILQGTPSGGTWSGTGIVSAVTGAFNPGVSGVGTFLVTYTVNNCVAPATTEITVVEFTEESTITNPGVLCSGQGIVTLVSSPTGGLWSGPGIVNANTGAFDPAVAGVGTVEVTYAANACSTPSSTSITIIESVAIELSPVAPVCVDAVPFDLVSNTPGGTWSGTGITDQTLGIFDPSVAGIGEFTITYTIPNTCDGTETISIEVIPSFELSITNPGSQCVTAPAFNLVASPTGGVWSGNGIVDAATGLFDVSVAGVGTAEVTYEVPNSCSTPVSVTFVITEFIDATIAEVNPICETAEPIQLTSAALGGTWAGNGVDFFGLFDPSVAGPGSTTITYTVNDVCVGQDQVTIQVVAEPEVVFSIPSEICLNQVPVVLQATPIGGSWSGDGVLFVAFDPAVAGVGPHQISYSLTGICTLTEEFTITVNPLPVVQASANQAICAGATTTISATGAATYQWSPSGSNPNSAFNNVAPNTTTTYTVTGTSADGCQGTDQVVVTVNQLPNVVASAASSAICEEESVQLTATGLVQYLWTPTSLLDDANIASPTASPFSSEVFTVSGVDANGCQGSATVSVDVIQLDFELSSLPPNQLNAQNVIEGQLPVIVDFIIDSNADNFIWDFDGDETVDFTTTANQVQHTFYGEGGNAGYVVADLEGCTDTIFFSVVAFTTSFIEIPNVITPNGDGKNDSFRALGNFIDTFQLQIFNRNGNLIETLNDLDEVWDFRDSYDSWSPRGEFNDGTYMYYYVAKGLDGQELKGSGTITVIGNE